MTRHEGSNPARISDELMLGYVEGELSAEDEHRLESSLSREMLATLLAMRADAEGLRSMSDLKAPAGLLSGVADLIEREMLLGVRESLGAESDELPVSRVVTRVSKDSPWKRAGSMVQSRQFALAASLVLLIGGAALVLPSLIGNGSPRRGPSGPIAMSDRAVDPGADELISPPVLETADRGVPNPELNHDLAIGPVPSAADPVAKPALTIDRAARLLSERRLVLRVRTPDSEGVRTWLARVNDRSSSVHFTEDVSPQLRLALLSAPEVAAPGGREEPAPIALAGDGPAPPRIDLREADRAFGFESFDPIVVLLEMNADPRSIEAALRAFKTQTGREAVLEELAEPLAVPAARPAADELLWWTRPANEWKTRAVLPVIVESGLSR